MAIVRYNPWAEMNAIQRQIDRLFEDLQTPSFRVPAAELTETEDALHLKLELPGMEAKDVDIEVTKDAVKVVAERKTEHQEGTHSEFYYGKYQRVIPLKTKVQNTNVTAEYKNGILNLTLPKAEEEKNKVVKVSLGEN
ncbi:Hsp20/alpha crystallin family protein [Calothrix sp. NIES-3974]|uniref:Hsp20/alpha crystallin family protein n=1 Tax=Calothrix sp. NIES-3974 TaxID=2005462 RepID=UPI000B5ED535|nr:Hsp20/alpha crystallin family protein [Calothrix sp. NIES-3974]BAZ07200.1 heat shock protein Hsp20 [Calothrix sp. NIES-3974]